MSFKTCDRPKTSEWERTYKLRRIYQIGNPSFFVPILL
ncbi:hypothetical protein B6N60_04780 [Richelia sinica FACHB-800]|uniref:Uncharacterized protein n=1 Tax=Richelia sinica FACHB-800 TaxID=1357546 RepID=A0A975Y787_9NOST|nr:hypothetical protein B6N60_04780 [Richelia sinica FACHB-800]